jgi:hypothetical protein
MSTLSRRKIVRGFVVAASGCMLAACVAVERDIVTAPPPALRTEVVPVLPPERVALEYWQPGHWRWNGREYVWIEGRYVIRPRPRAVWVAPQWERRRTGWLFVEGHWT